MVKLTSDNVIYEQPDRTVDGPQLSYGYAERKVSNQHVATCENRKDTSCVCICFIDCSILFCRFHSGVGTGVETQFQRNRLHLCVMVETSVGHLDGSLPTYARDIQFHASTNV